MNLNNFTPTYLKSGKGRWQWALRREVDEAAVGKEWLTQGRKETAILGGRQHEISREAVFLKASEKRIRTGGRGIIYIYISP